MPVVATMISGTSTRISRGVHLHTDTTLYGSYLVFLTKLCTTSFSLLHNTIFIINNLNNPDNFSSEEVEN